MDKETLLRQLASDTWVALQPSPIHGIGVFAIRDIPKGCRTIFSEGVGEWIRLPIKDVEQLPDHSRNLVETYCLYDENDYFVPTYGFKLMDLVLYLNHSSTPNIRSVDDGAFFEALADIKAGTELLVNYGNIVETTEYE
ncbi:MAG: SET domain-containing protein [Chitinophagaceae bacterium]|nr:SET domain-containing protein [Chitinophagaceae bacterium]